MTLIATLIMINNIGIGQPDCKLTGRVSDCVDIQHFQTLPNPPDLVGYRSSLWMAVVGIMFSLILNVMPMLSCHVIQS